MRLFWGVAFCLFFASLVHSQVYAQVYGGITPFPTMPLCSSGTCGDVCTGGLCPPPATCTPFCNNTTGYCGFTCSTFQSTCTTGWGAWGESVNGRQFRGWNNNPQLHQTKNSFLTKYPRITGRKQHFRHRRKAYSLYHR